MKLKDFITGGRDGVLVTIRNIYKLDEWKGRVRIVEVSLTANKRID